MSRSELADSVLALPEDERLELARAIVASLQETEHLRESVAKGVRRLEDMVEGRVKSLSEAEYRDAVQ